MRVGNLFFFLSYFVYFLSLDCLEKTTTRALLSSVLLQVSCFPKILQGAVRSSELVKSMGDQERTHASGMR